MPNLTIGAVLLLILIAGCGSDSPIGVSNPDVPSSSDRFDLSGLGVDDTQSEIIRLLHDGYAMYVRIQSFNSGGVISPACFLWLGLPEECNTWPDTVVYESWQIVAPSGDVDRFYSRYTSQDGNLLATGIQGDGIDFGTGNTWTDVPIFGVELIRRIEGMSTTIERVKSTYSVEVIEGNYLGRPSIIVPRSLEEEYQIANPLLFRETRWNERDDGTRYIISETKFVDFAMLPPDSFPEFALTSDN